MSSFYCAYVLFSPVNHSLPFMIYTLSLHDALPISDHRTGSLCGRTLRLTSTAPRGARHGRSACRTGGCELATGSGGAGRDRKSTRLNSSHANLVCRLLLEKKNK